MAVSERDITGCGTVDLMPQLGGRLTRGRYREILPGSNASCNKATPFSVIVPPS
jgi:hypothetical protein